MHLGHRPHYPGVLGESDCILRYWVSCRHLLELMMRQCPGSLLVGECELCSFASGKIFVTNLKAVKHLLMENLKKICINIIESFCCTLETHTGL